MAKNIKVIQPTTGYTVDGGILMLGENNPIPNLNSISVNRPKTLATVCTQGDIPTDVSDNRTATTVSFSLFDGSVPLFSCSAQMAIQGQSTAYDQRKGYSFKFYNADTSNKLLVQIGDWLPAKKLDMKAYPLDRLYVRDTFCAELWRNIRKTTNEFICPESVLSSYSDINNGTVGGSLFSTDGFIVQHIHNGAFSGLYVLRTTGDAPDYMMDTGNNNHIMIQPNHAGGIWNSNFNSTQWSISSPAINGYNDYDDISTTAPDLNTKCSRIIQWFLDVQSGKQDMRQTYQSYINLQSWIDYMLLCEITGSCDSITNNFQMCSWDGIIWYICAYDMDETLGVITKGDRPTNDPEEMGLIMDYIGGGAAATNIFRTFYKTFKPEIRASWRKLRDEGVVDITTLKKKIYDIVSVVPPSLFEDDLAIWPKSTSDLNNFTTVGTSTLPYVVDWLSKRIGWLDEQWAYYPV